MARPVDPAALAALGQVELHYTRDLESIWADCPEHVAELNGAVLQRLGQAFARGTRPDAADRPLGWAVIGTAGTGKTHLLGALRRQVWQEGGWFVLLDLLDVNDFWGTTALGFVDSLTRPMPGQASQGLVLVDRLCARFELEAMAAALATADAAGWAEIVRAIAAAVRREDSRGALAHRDVIPVLLALLSADPELQDCARAWLTGTDIETGGRHRLALMRSAIPPRRAVEGLSWLMSLGGPTMCALDQIDAIVSVAHAAAGAGTPSEDKAQNRALAVIDELAGGLMDLREVTRRTIPVVASLEGTWATLCARAIAAFRDRFQPVRLEHIGHADTAAGLVGKRLATAYAEAGFAPPYPTWPFRPEAFAGVTQFSPRQLLQACRAHVEACLDTGEVTELAGFPNATTPAGPPPSPAGPPPSPEQDAINPPPPPVPPAESPIDARYAVLSALPPPPGLLGLGGDDARVVELLLAALQALVRQSALPATQDMLLDRDIPGLHARLRLIDNAAGGRERHHGFRAIPHTNAIAAQTRLQQAITGAGIDRDLPFRHLVVLRDGRLAERAENGGDAAPVRAARRPGAGARCGGFRPLRRPADAARRGARRARRLAAPAPAARRIGLLSQPRPGGGSAWARRTPRAAGHRPPRAAARRAAGRPADDHAPTDHAPTGDAPTGDAPTGRSARDPRRRPAAGAAIARAAAPPPRRDRRRRLGQDRAAAPADRGGGAPRRSGDRARQQQ